MSLDPDALALCQQFRAANKAAHDAYRDLELVMLTMQAKGLAPNADGSAPDGLAVDPATGTVGGNVSTIRWEDILFGFLADRTIGAAMGSALAGTSRTVEQQIMRTGGA